MHAKTAGRLIGSTWLAVGFVFANGFVPLAVMPASATGAVPVQFAALKTAPHTLAQAHLAQFFEFALSPAATHALPRVKVAIEARDHWVEPLALTPHVYTGRLVNAENGRVGDEVIEFTKENVRDWVFVGQNKKIFGNFQTRAMVSELAPSTASQIAAVLSAQPIPANW